MVLMRSSGYHIIGLLLLFICSQCGVGTALQTAQFPGCESLLQTDNAAPYVELCERIQAGQWPEPGQSSFADLRLPLRDFYEPAHYSLAWSAVGKPTPQALALIDLLQHADLKGLDPKDYDGPLWAERLARVAQPGPNVVRFDLSLTIAAMRYMSALQHGRIDPKQLQFDLPAHPTNWNAAEFLRSRVVAAADVSSAVQEVEPPYPQYRHLLEALQHYLELQKKGDGDPLPPMRVKSIKPGAAYSGVPQLAERLRLFGDLASDATIPANASRYEGELVKAVIRFQQRHGLFPDGAIGADTFKELNTPVHERIAQLQNTLERWRWLPHDLHPPLMVVNIPEFRLRAFDDSQPPLSMKVIVGKAEDKLIHKQKQKVAGKGKKAKPPEPTPADRQTPVFADKMEYVIFHPYWNVPDGITQDELIPEMEKNADYMTKHSYEIVTRKGDVVASDKVSKDVMDQLESGDLEVRQRPGPDNSLGSIKFVFPNHYNVYLHGTPERNLFARPRRDFSHGCIRVEDPVALATWVLHDNKGWNPKRIQEAMKETEPLTVYLHRPIPVLIVYGTAYVEENGEVHFFDDIYGRDAALQQALTTHNSSTLRAQK
jgi:L,D-transpeptidase YcbB